MNVFVVLHKIQYEDSLMIGIYSTFDNARECELRYIKENAMVTEYEWTEIVEVEVDRDYTYSQMACGIGQVLE